MTDIVTQGVIDFIDAKSVLGWFELESDEPVSASLVTGVTASPVVLTPDRDKSMRWRFHARPEHPVTALDFASGLAALRINQGNTSQDLPLWKPLAIAATVQDLNPKLLPFLLRTLSKTERDALDEELENLAAPMLPLGAHRHRSEKRALFGNAEFRVLAGSELVILEIIEALSAQGWSCDVTAWSIGDPMRTLAQAAGAQLIASPQGIRAFDYDLVWLNNRLEAVFDYEVTPKNAPRTLFVFAHLDPGWSFSQPGAVVEQALGGLFLVAAPKGINRIANYGVALDRIRLFRNPAPKAFDLLSAPQANDLKRLLIVSNHAPAEVKDAAVMLRDKGVSVEHWGSGGDVTGLRLTPEALHSVDAVLTIGKTIPYALRAQRPAYVYDHFGGPGWLSEDNFASVASRNFSGLCCERRLDAAALCDELLTGFTKAAATAVRAHPAWILNYRLEQDMAWISSLQERAPRPEEHRQKLDRVRGAWRGECDLALTAGTYFRNAIAAHRAKMR